MDNPCIECGKQRIDGRSWKSRSGTAVVIYTTTICPDPSCQRIVDKAISDRKEKSEMLIKKKAEAKIAREKLLAAN